MTLRRRLTVGSAAAVGVAVALAALVAYLAVRGELRSQVDEALLSQAALIREIAAAGPEPGMRVRRVLPAPPIDQGGGAVFVQRLAPDGVVESALPGNDILLPVSDAARRTAAGEGPADAFSDAEVGGVHVRVLTARIGDGSSVQLGRSVDSDDAVLFRLRIILALLVAGGIGVAALLGRVVSRSVVAPITRLSETAEHISRTHDLRRRIGGASRDEVGQLARRFDTMLDTLETSQGALDRSVRAQRQLVADASHELRTPVTSLRTNVEVLLEAPRLQRAERDQLLADVRDQSEELGELVGDLIELARGDQPPVATEDVRLDDLVGERIARMERHARGARFERRLAPVVVEGDPARLGRAVDNLLDNAVRHGGMDGPIEVSVDAAGLRVRDHGPGIDPEDVDHLFDRFYRGAAARAGSGTGLGLAIVRQVAETHGGSVRAANAHGGGAELRMTLPVT